MSQAPELPGYYYDSEKKKYFKIQANAPSSSAYSSQDVKRRKIDDENNKAQSLKVQRNVGRIKRARILEAPISGGFLSREFGQPCLDTVAASSYAQNLIKTGDTGHWGALNGPQLFAVIPKGSGSFLYFPMVINNCIRHLSFDCRIKTSEGRVTNVFESNARVGRSDPLFPPSRSYAAGPRVTSISANKTIGYFATTWLNVPTDRSIVISPCPLTPGNIYDLPSRADIHIGPGTTRGNVDILSSTSAPLGSQDAFAIGASKGILRIDKNLDMSWIRSSPTEKSHHSQPRDVFALQYCPNHKDILLAGERRGILSILDLRIPQFWPPAEKIQHTSCITHIESLDTHRVLVAGCASDLHQYDRRFTKPNPQHTPRIKTSNTTSPTTPYLTYPEYRNKGRIDMGLDVDLELGLVAAAADNESKIKLFSLHGGQVLGDVNIPDARDLNCFKFVQDTENGPKSIWAACPDKLMRFSFEGE
ncbi:hypothetical protein sscle_01g007180 [Sclerotinia sclerotiorum 1980 UF-70]|uniref:Myocyte-specific enhancer factor 2d n=1 Tax=Sclerotinia sclerotiorum (strain ATCC 18683 / 1980 / Ss-1) TaxID=665079 RepID=A0A1D9PTB3_SCLS1|nr:hypothetical protein sscle_01g007180 [Sclerotinia sclerotiorum 1980 UF-70]